LALGHIHSEATIVVPALIKSLHDPEGFVCVRAAVALGEFGTNADAAVPALIDWLKDTNREPGAAIHALKQIDAKAAATAGIR